MPGGSVFAVTPCVVAGASCVRKTLLGAVAGDPLARDALVREARFLSLAKHPAVPRLVEVGRGDAGPFVVEEAVEGLSLGAIVERHDGAVPALFALFVVREAAQSLSEIHALADDAGPLDLVHGDPSPENLMVSADARVRFVDFGGASYRGAPDVPLAQHGTPPYAAPELLRGEARPSQGTDTYALAALAIALLTGAPLRPELEPAARLLRAAELGVDLGPLERAALPPRLVASLAGMVAFAPSARRGSLAALADALDTLAR